MGKTLITEYIKRLQSENPKFWAILSKYSLIAAVLISAVLGLHSYKIFDIPQNWVDLLSHIDAGLAGMFIAAQGGTTQPHLMDDKTIENVKQDNSLR